MSGFVLTFKAYKLRLVTKHNKRVIHDSNSWPYEGDALVDFQLYEGVW